MAPTPKFRTIGAPLPLSPRRCPTGAPLLLCVSLLSLWGAASGQLRYSIPEEMRKGSFVGNVALDLGMDAQELSEGGARILSRGRKQHFALNENNGHLFINEQIDREDVCGHDVQCTLNVEIISSSFIKVYVFEIEIKDINDNSPTFIAEKIELQIIESTVPGARFALPAAQDADVGINSLQNYQLSDNKHFTLDVKERRNGMKSAELVLEKSLDREEQDVHALILTATDGGSPARSGTVRIHVTVLDVNDNAPVFSQNVYKFSVLESAPKGAVVGAVKATDHDQALTSGITYSFYNIEKSALKKIELNSKTGDMFLAEALDFEQSELYQFEVQASDGSLTSFCEVVIGVINVNDNNPEILTSTLLKKISENSPLGTVIAVLEVYDRDSGDYGRVTCFLPPHLPFHLKKATGTYSLLTAGVLDREQVPEYNITITATDSGTPPLSKTETINLQITDENDNPPVFQKTSYNVYIMETIPQGTSIFTAKATDLDWDRNAKVTYSIIDGHIGDAPLSSHISINSQSGVIYALQSFDFELLQEFQIQVKAQDGGSPPLENNVTVTFFILDQNDNTPEILHPSIPTDGSSGVEMAPRTSEPGYLITKVVAVDADSGQNAWLSFQMLRFTDQGLFTVGLHTGEIRTARPVMEKDAMKQYLVVLVKDNGQPPLSSSVTVTIVLADSMPEMLHDISDPPAPTDMESSLTLYLVIAVAVVSFLFLFLIILLVGVRLHHWRQSQLCDPSGVNFSALPASQFVGIDGVRAFLQPYSGDVYLTTDSGKSQFKIPNPSNSTTLSENKNCEKQGSALIEDFLSIDKEEQAFTQV